MTFLFDSRHVILTVLQMNGFTKRSNTYKLLRILTGYAIKLFALQVVFLQEKGRVVRWLYYELRKYDSGIYPYNLFFGRSPLLGNEQPESVYFMDKFLQPTHLYLHSNMYDYPETARKEGITSNKDWKQTVVTYEAFRMPGFAPKFIQQSYKNGDFDLAIPREEFKGTDAEY